MHGILSFLQSQIGHHLIESPSPFAHWLNGKLVAADRGKVVVDVEVRPDMANPIGTIHGGVVAAILDEMIGMCVFTLEPDRVYASVNLSVDFLEFAKVGEIIRAEAVIVREGARLMNGKANLKVGTRLVATATSNLTKTAFPMSEALKKVGKISSI